MIDMIVGLIGGGVSGIITLVLIGGAVVFAASRFAIVRRGLFFVINLFPAVFLWVLGIIAIPLWRLMDRVVGFLLRRIPIDAMFARWVDRLGQVLLPKPKSARAATPGAMVKTEKADGGGELAAAQTATAATDSVPTLLLRGQRRAVSESMWPAEWFPDLYRDVPPDVLRPPYDDGRLIGGLRLHWLADRYMTEAALRGAVRIGVNTALLAFVGIVVLFVFMIAGAIAQQFGQMSGGDMPVEQWPDQAPILIPTSWKFTAAMSVLGPALLKTLGSVTTFIPGTAVSCIGIGLLVVLLVLRTWQATKAAPYEWQSKDADVRWAFRTETRDLVRATYRRQVKQATERLKDAATFFVGRATGMLRARGDLSAPLPGQQLCLDQESLFQHLLTFGGTGEGKTTALIKPLVRQILRQPSFGMYVCDAKGVLWQDIINVAKTERPGGDLIVIGTGPDQFGVDLLAGLNATQVAGTLRSVMAQVSGSGSGGDAFWPDMAATVLRNVLSVARAYGMTEQGKTAVQKTGAVPYSLWWAYQAVLNAAVMTEATNGLREWIAKANDTLRPNPNAPEHEALRALYRYITSREVYDSIAYLEGTWRDMAPQTKSGIVAKVTQLLDGFAGAQVLRERFACGNPKNTIAIAEALKGKVVLNALSSMEDGLPARVVSILLKTNLYREARNREANFRRGLSPTPPQSQPCIVVMDEVQELVTADVSSGLSDATFWNVARSTGVAGIFATQTVAALYQAIGKESATNFMQQARSKVFFRTEDQETVEYACWCAGRYERNRVFDDGHRESIEYRGLIDGWSPLEPFDEQEGPTGGARVFFDAAKSLLAPDRLAIGTAQAQSAYGADSRFILDTTSGETGNFAQIQSMQSAIWRAEDLERDFRKSGNDLADAVAQSDLIHMGRWHAFAHLQRAGAVRQDIIQVEHDFA